MQSIKVAEEANGKELKELQGNLINYKNQIESINKIMAEKEEKHKEEIQNLKDKLNLDCEKQLLKLEKAYQTQIQNLREEYNQQARESFKQMQQFQQHSKRSLEKQNNRNEYSYGSEDT